jgi:flavin-dependent dehydrogenase
MEDVEHLIVGAGPAGLRAAQVLAEAGREVLVLEKRPEIGPKTCAGGLTVKTMDRLEQLGLPRDVALRSLGHVAFSGSRAVALDQEITVVYTLPRSQLGQYQLTWCRNAGAEVCAGVAAREINLPGRTVACDGRRIRWRHLIGADGADSGVRRALGLPSPRAYFAAEYNIPGVRLEPLRVECDPAALKNGYFWVFPHVAYTSIGVVAPKHLVAPSALRRYLDRRLDTLGLSPNAAPFEAATLEVHFRGFHFAGQVHLVGDAAGVPSSLTAEGIYAALVTGEEVARSILDPSYLTAASNSWLQAKRRHDRLARFMSTRMGRAAAFPALAALAWLRPARRPMAEWFVAG